MAGGGPIDAGRQRFSQVSQPYRNSEQDRFGLEAASEFAEMQNGDEERPYESVPVEVLEAQE